MIDRFRNEPSLAYSLVGALIALGVSFGLSLTGEQVGAIMAVVAILTGVSIRQAVYGPGTVDKVIDAESVIEDARHREAP